MFNQEKENVGAKNILPVQEKKRILTQEQIAQLLSEEKLSYRSPEVFINDFLFVWKNHQQNFEKVLDMVFMNYIKERPFFSMYDIDENQVVEAYHFFTLICRHRELLVQIATDKGIRYNPKNQ